jgi:sigma-B regulation protein RsbU (phosphoserine phosphatase)
MSQVELQVERLKALVRASRLLNTSLQLEVVLETFLKTALESLESDHGTVYLLNRQGTELASFALAADEGAARPLVQSIRLPVGKGISGYVAATGEPVLLNDPYSDPRFYQEVDKKSGVRTRNLLTVPILNESREIIGVMQVLNHPTGYVPEDIDFLIELSSQAAVAIERARLHEALLEKSRLEKELDIARQIQERLLPPISLSRPDFQVASFSNPCYQVGGDFFDLESVGEGKFMLACGDVSGKGVPAALVNSLVKASYRHLLQQYDNPQPVMNKLNRFIKENVLENKFCTMVVAKLDVLAHTVVYCNAGHNYPILLHPDGDVEPMTQGGVPLGLMPSFEYLSYEHRLKPADRLLLYSDGVTEAVNPDDEEFGEERLIETLRAVRRSSVDEGIRHICSTLKEFTQNQPQADDITMLFCCVP